MRQMRHFRHVFGCEATLLLNADAKRNQPDGNSIDADAKRGEGRLGCYTLSPCNTRGVHVSRLIIISCLIRIGHVTPTRL